MAVRGGNVPKFRGHLLPRHDDGSSLNFGSFDTGERQGRQHKEMDRVKKHNRSIGNISPIGRFCGGFSLIISIMSLFYSEYIGGVVSRLSFPKNRQPPRIFFLKNMDETIHFESRKGRTRRMIMSDNQLEGDRYYDDHQATPDNADSGCPFVNGWTKSPTPRETCNIQHELALEFQSSEETWLQPIGSGAFKDVWRVLQNNVPVPFVLKTQVYDSDFSQKYLFKHQRDALVMEASSESPYTLDMYSYCSYSSLAESAKGTLEDWLESFAPHSSFDEADYDPKLHPSPRHLLQVATMMARGVADAQLFTRNGLPSYTHADIKASQFLLVSDSTDPRHPVVKLNDFNRGRFLSAKDGVICPFYMSTKHKGSTMRSPEEYEKRGPQTDKIDVFSLGSALYELLTCRRPFEGMKFDKAIRNILNNVPVPLPSALTDSNDPSIRAIIDTMMKCRQFQAEERPSSQQIANALQSALDSVQRER